MVIAKIDYHARIKILREEHMNTGIPNIGYSDTNQRMERMSPRKFTKTISETLIKRMLHENKVPNFNIGGKLVYISDPQTIKELEEKIKNNDGK